MVQHQVAAGEGPVTSTGKTWAAAVPGLACKELPCIVAACFGLTSNPVVQEVLPPRSPISVVLGDDAAPDEGFEGGGMPDAGVAQRPASRNAWCPPAPARACSSPAAEARSSIRCEFHLKQGMECKKLRFIVPVNCFREDADLFANNNFLPARGKQRGDKRR
jgi:hypothetical protein